MKTAAAVVLSEFAAGKSAAGRLPMAAAAFLAAAGSLFGERFAAASLS